MNIYRLSHFQTYAQKCMIHVAVILAFLGGTVGQGICSAEANLAQLNQVTTYMANRMKSSSGGGSNQSFITFFDDLIRIAQRTLITKDHVTSGGLDAEVNFYTNYLYSIGQALDILTVSNCLAIQQRIQEAQRSQPSYQLHVLGRTIASVYDVVKRIKTPNSRLRFATYDEFRQKIMTIISQERAERERAEQQRAPQQRNTPSAAAEATKALVVTMPAVQTQTPSSDEATRRAVFLAQMNAKKQDPYQQMEEYIQKSSIVNMYAGAEREEIATAMRTALTKQIQDNGGKWMGGETLKVAEHFYWNLISIKNKLKLYEIIKSNKIIINFIFGTQKTGTWDNFVTFCAPYIGVTMQQRESLMRDLFPIYQAFPKDDERRQAFMDFSASYTDGKSAGQKIGIMNDLLPIYQAFPKDDERRQAFMDFSASYTDGRPAYEKESTMNNLLPIYQAFLNNSDRQAFINFCASYTDGKCGDAKASIMNKLLPIYQAFLNDRDRQAFINFCTPYINYRTEVEELEIRNILLPIYKNPLERQKFNVFTQPHLTRGYTLGKEFLEKYLARTYLRYMRVDSALKAEPLDNGRVQPMYETDLDDQLPVFFAQDPFMQQARVVAHAVANAHEFDAIYEQDQAILWGLATAPTESAVTRTIYNNHEAPYNHHSNVEVDDFITYLETDIAREGVRIDGRHLSGERVVYIIKMLLGLAPKDTNTTGGFPPYLSSSMYYAKPQSPRGDEMLGRTWAFMKQMADKKKDPDLKKAVVLALLETVEISGAHIHTHCQTRTSGELFKMLSWHLPDSKLRSLISANDLPTVVSDTDMPARINAAPIRARDLFKIMKQEDEGERRRLIERCIAEDRDPELWERYEAYYDDLYRRTKVTGGTPYNENLHIRLADGRMYRRDEHILTRDDRGNLVSAFNADGALRAQPIIVYYQAEFQVFEHAFTQLMKREFEDQRGLKY